MIQDVTVVPLPRISPHIAEESAEGGKEIIVCNSSRMQLDLRPARMKTHMRRVDLDVRSRHNEEQRYTKNWNLLEIRGMGTGGFDQGVSSGEKMLEKLGSELQTHFSCVRNMLHHATQLFKKYMYFPSGGNKPTSNPRCAAAMA